MNILIYIQNVVKLLDCILHQKCINLFHQIPIPPLRPIVSSIDTYNYKLAQYLGSLLAPHILSNFTSKDSFTFIEEIKQLNTYDKFLIYFDVTSLFTNTPLEETINIAIYTIFENYPNVKFTRKELQKLFKIATSETHFIFNNEIYDQIDGVSMGSPPAPILANLFMVYHEKDWIEKVHNFQNSTSLDTS